MKSTPFHVYTMAGFDSAYTTARAAITAAKRGAKRTGQLTTVVRCGVYGATGRNQGDEIWASNGETIARGR
jgi:hypothetical protein